MFFGGASYRGWIPAFAGMTDGEADCRATAGASYRGWIPAFAGMTDGGADCRATAGARTGDGFPRSRE